MLCQEQERRFELNLQKARRAIRENEVAAALAARADTLAGGKVRWDHKLPTVKKLAKTAANKAQQALKTADTQDTAHTKAGRARSGVREENQPNLQQMGDGKAKAKAKPKLRIQRDR